MTDYPSDITPMSNLTLSEAMELIETLRLDINHKARLAEELTSETARLQRFNDALSQSNRAMTKTLEDAKMHLEVYLDDNDIEIEEGTDFEALCNLLEVERTQTIDIKVTVSWSVSAIIPRNYDPQQWVDEQTWEAELSEDHAELDGVFEIETTAKAY